jgi:hypothetical protein
VHLSLVCLVPSHHGKIVESVNVVAPIWQIFILWVVGWSWEMITGWRERPSHLNVGSIPQRVWGVCWCSQFQNNFFVRDESFSFSVERAAQGRNSEHWMRVQCDILWLLTHQMLQISNHMNKDTRNFTLQSHAYGFCFILSKSNLNMACRMGVLIDRNGFSQSFRCLLG